MLLRQLAEYVGQDFRKISTLVLKVIIFIPAMSHAATKPFNYSESKNIC